MLANKITWPTLDLVLLFIILVCIKLEKVQVVNDLHFKGIKQWNKLDILYSCKHFKVVHVLRLVYCSYIQSNLEYCFCVWSPFFAS